MQIFIFLNVQKFLQSFLGRPAEVVGAELVGCRLITRRADGHLLWGVIVEMEACSQDDPACQGYVIADVPRRTKRCLGDLDY